MQINEFGNSENLSYDKHVMERTTPLDQTKDLFTCQTTRVYCADLSTNSFLNLDFSLLKKSPYIVL